VGDPLPIVANRASLVDRVVGVDNLLWGKGLKNRQRHPTGSFRLAATRDTRWDYEGEGKAPSPAARSQSVSGVVTEHADGSCVAFSRGRLGEWPSRADAMGAVEDKVGPLAWRESVSGVWVGFVSDSQPLATSRGEGHMAMQAELDPDRQAGFGQSAPDPGHLDRRFTMPSRDGVE